VASAAISTDESGAFFAPGDVDADSWPAQALSVNMSNATAIRMVGNGIPTLSPRDFTLVGQQNK
jgi:hypothetical protein